MVRLRSTGIIRLALILVLQAWLIVDTGGAAMALTLSSSAFKPSGKIPSKYTCEGSDASPPLSFGVRPKALRASR